MEKLGVPCVRRGKGFRYLGCNIFYFGRIELSWYSRQAFWGCCVSNGTYVGCFTTKSCLVTPENFRGGWESWSKNVILTFSVTIWVWTSPLSFLSCISFIRLLSILWFIETEKKDMHSLKVFFELRAYADILELLLEFSYLLYYKDMQYAHWS